MPSDEDIEALQRAAEAGFPIARASIQAEIQAAFRSNFLNDDGGLRLVQWAHDGGRTLDGGEFTHLLVDLTALPTRMAHSTATGRGLVTNGDLGVDLIRLAGGESFVPHTHHGDHLLIVVGGRGTITVNGRIYETHAGQLYMVEGKVPHAVGAITDHVILAVGSPHKAVDDTERMAPTEYRDVLATIDGKLTCTICHVWTMDSPIHEKGCNHCPCPWCVTTGDHAEDERLRAAWLKV